MSTKLFSELLSQNYIELLKDDEYYDITIEVAHIKLPKISPEIFQTILEYIYGGILSLNKLDISDFLKVLAAADNLHLQELVNYLQKYLIENKSDWIEQHFGFTQQISSRSNNLLELQEFCTNLMAQTPEKIFNSFDFTSLSEKSLISLIKRDDLQMKEIKIWEHVLKWGLAQNPTLIPDPKTWSDDDFKTVKNTLQSCLPLIRFFSLSSKELSQKVRPYQKLLNQQLYEDLIYSYMDPDSVSTDNILLPRNIIMNKIDSNINFKDAIISDVINANRAIHYGTNSGPYFGDDIIVYNSGDLFSTDYNRIRCKNKYYEKKIRDSDDYFSIEDYEVFQIVKS
ncbi:BTB/POZ protein [Rhizophagus irregularis DAOM 181602=DAOM 197198]|nr:BTB/POZ protein [Rhizophagus irregularis DAOM 181602=DAOM 197198]